MTAIDYDDVFANSTEVDRLRAERDRAVAGSRDQRHAMDLTNEELDAVAADVLGGWYDNTRAGRQA